MANPQRLRRVAEQIQRELSEILRIELKDPRVGMITLTGVEVTPDLAHAKVFFTSLSGAGRRDEVLKGLARAGGFLRTMLGAQLKTHNVPELHFVYDETVESGIRLTHLIEDAVASDAARHAPRRRRRSR
jgi:ribosome-binding factor A